MLTTFPSKESGATTIVRGLRKEHMGARKRREKKTLRIQKDVQIKERGKKKRGIKGGGHAEENKGKKTDLFIT